MNILRTLLLILMAVCCVSTAIATPAATNKTTINLLAGEEAPPPKVDVNQCMSKSVREYTWLNNTQGLTVDVTSNCKASVMATICMLYANKPDEKNPLSSKTFRQRLKFATIGQWSPDKMAPVEFTDWEGQAYKFNIRYCQIRLKKYTNTVVSSEMCPCNYPEDFPENVAQKDSGNTRPTNKTLNSLFEQENGGGSYGSSKQISESGKGHLEALMKDEVDKEAEARKKKEEQDRIAAEQQRQQQLRAEQIAEQRHQYQAAERARKDEYDSLVQNCRLSKSSCEGGCLGAGLGGSMVGSKTASFEYYGCQRTCEQQNRNCLESAENMQRQSTQADPSQAMMNNIQQEVNQKQQQEQAEQAARRRAGSSSGSVPYSYGIDPNRQGVQWDTQTDKYRNKNDNGRSGPKSGPSVPSGGTR